MLVVLLSAGIALLVILVIYEFSRQRRRARAFQKFVAAAGVEGRWVEILKQAHETFPAAEMQKLEDAMRAAATEAKETARRGDTLSRVRMQTAHLHGRAESLSTAR